jgi:hypothetical protein
MTLILNLSDKKEAALKARALSQGLSADQYVQQMVDCELAQEEDTVSTSLPRRRISERIAEIMADVPVEELAKLPRDGARQVDHYVYGLPKRN